MVDADDRVLPGAGVERLVVAPDQLRRELPLGVADGAALFAVELDGDVGDPTCRDVRRDIDLAAPDDALVDDGLARLDEEARVGRVRPMSSSSFMSFARGFLSSIQPRNSQMVRKSSTELISGVPVSAMNSGEDTRDRICSAICSTKRERCESLFLMKCASSTTMPLKPKPPSHPACRSRIS